MDYLLFIRVFELRTKYYKYMKLGECSKSKKMVSSFSTSFVFIFVITLHCSNAIFNVWPIPKHVSFNEDGNKLKVSKDFRFILNKGKKNFSPITTSMKRLERGIDRFNIVVQNAGISSLAEGSADSLQFLEVNVVSDSNEEYPSIRTRYDYNITVQDGVANANASSPYGALYAMETFIQLIDEYGNLPGSGIEITDSPQNDWRGLMIDTGRRFFPVDTVENLLDVMGIVKLNVLHLHASDHCRFSVESKLYPNLTSSLKGDYGGFYKQDDIRHLVEYAADRGIRIVPEFDVPGHSKGFFPIASQGIKFCSAQNKQLYGDPGNSTYNILQKLFKEMKDLFKDEVFNIGADETSVSGPCSLQSTSDLEKKLLMEIQTNFNKTPEGWEELLFKANSATPESIVNAWARHTAKEIIDTGRKAVESRDSWFYFTKPAQNYPKGWEPCWNDIAEGINETSRHLLLGGEMSMWTDSYCIINQCLNTDKIPGASSLFPPAKDKEFQISIGGMIWPRGFVGAASFWGYNKSLDSQSQEFEDKVWKLNDMVIQRGGITCPTKCRCNQLEQCGKPISV